MQDVGVVFDDEELGHLSPSHVNEESLGMSTRSRRSFSPAQTTVLGHRGCLAVVWPDMSVPYARICCLGAMVALGQPQG